jgi:hypothetical protein
MKPKHTQLCISLIIISIFLQQIECVQKFPPLCRTEPRWMVDDRNILGEYYGKVVVLVTMQLHCDECRSQIVQYGRIIINKLININNKLQNQASRPAAILREYARHQTADRRTIESITRMGDTVAR